MKIRGISPDLLRLRSLLNYDPMTGVFTWVDARNGWANSRDRAGTTSDQGYTNIWLDGKSYRASHLAWFYVHGEWPTGEIDHKSGVVDDDRIDNLRPATRSMQAANQRRRSDNSSGFKGVCYVNSRDRWRAYIFKDGKQYGLGFHKTKEAAAAAYQAAAVEHFGEFARFE